MAIAIDTNLNIYDQGMGIIMPYYTILVLAIYIELYILLFQYGPIDRGGRIPVIVQKVRTILLPRNSLTSYSGRPGYGIGWYIIIHNITGTNKFDRIVGTWPSVIIRFTTLHDLRYEHHYAILYHPYISHICWVFGQKDPDCPSSLKQFNVVLRTG